MNQLEKKLQQERDDLRILRGQYIADNDKRKRSKIALRIAAKQQMIKHFEGKIND